MNNLVFFYAEGEVTLLVWYWFSLVKKVDLVLSEIYICQFPFCMAAEITGL